MRAVEGEKRRSIFRHIYGYRIARDAGIRHGYLLNNGWTVPPGDIAVMYGTGFGPTNPPAAADVIVSSANPLKSLSALSITIGGVPAQVVFAGVTATGLYQFNVTVPMSTPDGDIAVVAAIGSVRTQDGTVIPVHRKLRAQLKPAGRRSEIQFQSRS